jgi:3-oxoacyl-[acyl-carrier-protein] synthase-3
MRGTRLYKLAVHKVEKLVADLLDQAGLKTSDIDLVEPHQPSGPGLQAMRSRLDFPPECIIDVIGQYGNCIAASLPIALSHADATGRLNRGDKVLMIGMGAGVSIAGTILEW